MIVSPPDAIWLDVGGRRFVTSAATLRRRAPDFLDSLTACQSQEGSSPAANCEPDEPQQQHQPSAQPSEYIVDRDPKHFPAILNFLRTGACALPDNIAGLVELRAEAEAYEVCRYIEAICCAS